MSKKKSPKPSLSSKKPLPKNKKEKRRYTLEVDDAREALRAKGDEPTVRELCALLGMSPNKVLACIQKIDKRLPKPEKQGALKERFNDRRFKGFTYILVTGFLNDVLKSVPLSELSLRIYEMFRLLPEFKRFKDDLIKVVIEDRING